MVLVCNSLIDALVISIGNSVVTAGGSNLERKANLNQFSELEEVDFPSALMKGKSREEINVFKGREKSKECKHTKIL